METNVMTEAEMPPQYLMVDRSERGASLHISFDDYRALAHTALAVTCGLAAEMGLYTFCGPDSQGAGLDIWTGSRSITIRVDSITKQLALFLSDNIDSPEDAMLILSASSDSQGWQQLTNAARTALLS
jgi:hypothetical protein